MVDQDTPSVRERRLARELRQLRTGEQLHAKDVAARLGWSPSKVSRIETARIGIAADDLDRLLELYRVPDGQADLHVVLCPLHQHAFDLDDGSCHTGQPPLRSFPVRVDEVGGVYVTLDP